MNIQNCGGVRFDLDSVCEYCGKSEWKTNAWGQIWCECREIKGNTELAIKQRAEIKQKLGI